MILGESQYANTPQGIDSTIQLIQDQADSVSRETFYNAVERTIIGKRLTEQERHVFWRSVAFYNFIQEIVGSKARVRKRERMWAEALNPFREVLERLRPELLVVLGADTWKHLPDCNEWPREGDVRTGRVTGEVCRLTASGTLGYALGIRHPASPVFSADAWHDVIKLFFDRYAKARVTSAVSSGFR